MLASEIRSAVQHKLEELVQADLYRNYVGEQSQMLAHELASIANASECLLTSSGTVAVEIGLRALGIGTGDEVVLSAYDYPGNFWAIERVGARPVLVDVEPKSWRVSLEQVEAACASASCRCVIVSHLHGQLQDIRSLRSICDRSGKVLIEDCCQAIGAQLAGVPLGKLGDLATFSFGGGKLISAGRGGCLVTSDAALAQKAKLAAGAGSGPSTMSELQSGVVLAQLPFLTRLNAQCRNYFAEVHRCLTADRRSDQFHLPCESDLATASFYQAGWLLDDGDWNVDRGTALSSNERYAEHGINRLKSARIPAGMGFPGFHRRSTRRCASPFGLVNTPRVVSQTMTIHHRVVLDEQFTPQELAASMASSMDANDRETNDSDA